MSDVLERELLGGETALHTEKVLLRTFAGVMVGTASGFGLGAAWLTFTGLGGDPWLLVGAGGAAIMATAFGLFGLSFAVIRTVVTPSFVRVQMGPRQLEVPIAAIECVEAIDFGPNERVRFHRADASDFGARARNGRVVRVRWRPEGEEVATVYLASDHADVLADAIERAQGPRVRVDSEASEADGDALEATDAEREPPRKARTAR